MDPELLKVLCCPLCYSLLVEQSERLRCTACAREYPVVDGTADLRVYESPTYASEFNKEQALYEAGFHDERVETDYEERVIGLFGTKTRLMVENWAREMDGVPGRMVLDYGCGTGQVSRVMARRIKPLFAFDISEQNLRQNMHDNDILGVLANSLYLPFKENAFDFVFINGVLHHIIDLERAVGELARITAGSVYISEGVPRSKPSLARMIRYPGLPRKAAYGGYLIVHRLRTLLGRGKRAVSRLATALFRPQQDQTSKSHGSKYERALEVAVIEALLAAHGFQRNRLLYQTNIDIPGDGVLKNRLTRLLVNDVLGTHFDLRMDRSR
jgi:ubiquinone/menaquinone biosynthesis C-methylase UbiE